MATDVKIGWGSEFWLDNSAGTLTELSEVVGVGLPEPEVADVEATHMKSPSRKREYISGLIEDGTADFTFNYVPGGATDILLREARDSGTVRDYKIVIPSSVDADGWAISGALIVKKWARTAPIDDRMMAVLTVRFTGASTEAGET